MVQSRVVFHTVSQPPAVTCSLTSAFLTYLLSLFYLPFFHLAPWDRLSNSLVAPKTFFFFFLFQYHLWGKLKWRQTSITQVCVHMCWFISSICMCAQSIQSFQSIQSDFSTLWTVALQAPLSMGFFRQEYWNGLPCPPPGDLLDQDQTCISYISCIGRQVLYH